jgi:chromate reductase
MQDVRDAARAPWQVVAIAGSLRRDSLNRRLVEAAADCAPEGIEVRVYRGLGELPPFNQDLKNAIDWLSRPSSGEVLVGKPVAVVGASAGRWGTRLAQAALRQALFATESLIVTGPALYLAQTDAPFDPSGRLTDEAARSALRQILQALAQIMRTRA